MVVADNKQPLTMHLGEYEILRPLARGGMAELFLARVTGPAGFEKLLVLKKILPHLAENPRFVRSFLDEAKLVAGFDHPHIAHVHNMGTADGSYFFTMEFVHGVDVRELFKRCVRDRSPLPLEHAVLIVRLIASALHYAHERRGADGKSLNVVHRDVSPSNIIVSYDGVPKLVDFGIAKAASSSIRTQTGALKGKISYMSPEQAVGAPIDRRTDVFALGIILWELIANRRLFGGGNDLAKIQRIIHRPAGSPREHRHDCPPALERIVLRALALDIDARYQTAEQLQLELDDFVVEHKWKQSALALSADLRRTFALELASFEAAQAGGVTVTDAIAAPFDEHATRQLGLPDRDDDDDDDIDDDDIDDDDVDDDDIDHDDIDHDRDEARLRDESRVATTPVPQVRIDAGEEPRPSPAMSPVATTPVTPVRFDAGEVPRTSPAMSGEATIVTARLPRSSWMWFGGVGLSVMIGIIVAVATSQRDHADGVSPAIETAPIVPTAQTAPTAPTASTAPTEADIAVEPAFEMPPVEADVAVPEPAIEMPPVVADVVVPEPAIEMPPDEVRQKSPAIAAEPKAKSALKRLKKPTQKPKNESKRVADPPKPTPADGPSKPKPRPGPEPEFDPNAVFPPSS